MQTPLPTPIRRALEQVGSIHSIVPATSGRSGAEVWCVTTSAGRFAARCWPVGVTLQRVREIERFMRHLRGGNIGVVPAPFDVGGRLPAVDRAGRVWNIETWMEGSPVAEESIDEARLHAAIDQLAAIHRRSRELGPLQLVPLAVDRRAARLAELSAPLAELRRLRPPARPLAAAADSVTQYADEHLPALTADYRSLLTQPVPCWPVLRDVHRQHVLYEGSRVTGIVDFDAVRVDTPLADLARLLGSLLATDVSRYRRAIERYFAPLQPQTAQLRLIDLLDQATTLCAAVYWLETLETTEDARGLELLRWHTVRLQRFPFGWSRTGSGTPD